MVDGQLRAEGRRGRDHGCLLGPCGLATFHEARTNRPRVDLFLSHSCRHGIYEDVWGLAKGDLCTALPLYGPGTSTVCPSLLIPAEAGRSSTSDPSRRVPTYRFPSFLSLTCESLRMCRTPGLHALHHSTASSWWNLALLISISDFRDTGSFIIQGKPGDETTV